MKDLVAYLAKALVDNPTAVEVHELNEDGAFRYEISVAPGDIGKVIGKEGRTVKALRTLVAAVAHKSGHQVELDILDVHGEGRERRGPRR